MTALWQAPLTNAVVTGDLVVGLATGRPAVLEAISESTGQRRWTAGLPSTEPYVARLFAAGGVVVVEVGRALDDPAGSAGISGSLAGVVLSQAPSGAVSIGVFPLRGGGAMYKDFIVEAGPIVGGGTLLLLRRVDVSGYPLVALRVSA